MYYISSHFKPIPQALPVPLDFKKKTYFFRLRICQTTTHRFLLHDTEVRAELGAAAAPYFQAWDDYILS